MSKNKLSMQNYVDVMHKYTEEKLQLCYDNIRNKL